MTKRARSADAADDRPLATPGDLARIAVATVVTIVALLWMIWPAASNAVAIHTATVGPTVATAPPAARAHPRSDHREAAF
ncbi:MAG: hypothetical protein ACR2JQ_08390 [Mycobacteriales bacterium]